MRSHYFLVTCVTKPRQELSLSRLPTREQPGGCLSSGSGGKPAGRCALCLTRFLPKQPLLRTPETTITCRLNPMATGTHANVPDESFHGSEPPNESILLNVVQTHRSLRGFCITKTFRQERRSATRVIGLSPAANSTVSQVAICFEGVLVGFLPTDVLPFACESRVLALSEFPRTPLALGSGRSFAMSRTTGSELILE